MLAPRDRAAAVIHLLHRNVSHETVGGSAVPVVLAGLEEHAVTGIDDLDRAAATLRAPDTVNYVDRLAVGVRMPRGSSTRGEMDAGGLNAGRLRGRGDGVYVDRA